jgi:carbonic anhydrase
MIEELFERNVAWSMGRTRDDPDYFRRLAALQEPRYLWIGCSDSRVPANEIVGLDPGELFVHRNVANVVHTSDMNLLSVLEFAVGAIGVEHIIVCGHYGCGGVRRALEGGTGALVDHWLAPIADLNRRRQDLLGPIRDSSAKVNTLCELNVELQVRRVAATPIVAAAWAAGKPLAVHGWIYGLKDGLLRDLAVSLHGADDFRALDASVAEPDSHHVQSADAPLERAWLNAVRLLDRSS